MSTNSPLINKYTSLISGNTSLNTKPVKRNRWHKISTYLPIKVIERIKNFYDPCTREYDKAILICARIYNDYMVKDKLLHQPKEIPSSYISKVLHSRYYFVWKELVNIGIFSKVKNHGSDIGRSKSFVFHHLLVHSELTRVDYFATKKWSTPFCKRVKDSFKDVTLDLPQPLEEHIEHRSEQIKCQVVKKIDFKAKTYKPKKGRKVRIRGCIDEFILRQVDLIKKTEFLSVQSILDHHWRASRNHTNDRLDTNFTNLNGIYHPYICISGKAVKTLDLTNSQLCILSNLVLDILLLPSISLESLEVIDNYDLFVRVCKMFCLSEEGKIKEDVTRFCESSINGTLYEDIQRLLSLKTRKEAKNVTFKLLFGKVCTPNATTSELEPIPDNKLMSMLRKAYPNMVGMIQEFKLECTKLEKVLYRCDTKGYKKEHNGGGYISVGYKKFSVMLQKIESSIFIDNIYKPLLLDGHQLISCHDSLMFIDKKLESRIIQKLEQYLPHGFKLKS